MDTVTWPATAVDRLAWADRLKVGLTGAVITAHCGITYGADGSWFYREPTRIDAVRLALDVPLAMGALFAMGAFFFLAGCFVAPSLRRKGPARFTSDRALRLGVPTLAFIVLVIPATQWLVDRVDGPAQSAASAWRDQLSSWDTGPLWFALVLLLFSAAIAGVAAVTGRQVPAEGRPLTVRALVTCGLVVAVTTFALRLEYSLNTYQIAAAHLWQWGQCATLFVLGVLVGPRGLAGVSRGTAVACRWILGAGTAVVVGVLAAFADRLDPFGGGLHWQAALIALVEGGVSVAATVTALDLARRWFAGRPPSRLAPAAFGAYVLQVPVIVLLSLALRPVPVDGALKLLVLAPTAIAACFALAYALRAVPALRRYL